MDGMDVEGVMVNKQHDVGGKVVDDETLAKTVIQYPCLYDKSDDGFKLKHVKVDAWKEVERKLGLEEGVAEKRFLNLRNKFGRKRKRIIGAPPDAEYSTIIEAERKLQQYSYLDFLIPHQRQRQPKCSNGTKRQIHQSYSVEESASETPYFGDEDADIEVDYASYDGCNSTSSSNYETALPTAGVSDHTHEHHRESLNINVTTPNDYPPSLAIRAPPPMTSSYANENLEEDADVIFGKMVTSEFRLLSGDTKADLKHEINNLIYKFKVQERRKQQQQQQQQQQHSSPMYISHATTLTHNQSSDQTITRDHRHGNRVPSDINSTHLTRHHHRQQQQQTHTDYEETLHREPISNSQQQRESHRETVSNSQQQRDILVVETKREDPT